MLRYMPARAAIFALTKRDRRGIMRNNEKKFLFPEIFCPLFDFFKVYIHEDRKRGGTVLSKVFANKACGDALIKISEGDMNGLTVIYDQLGRQIFSLAFSVLGNYSDAEDAMQDTFLRIAKYAGNYDAAGNARAWIMAIARNAAVDTANRREIPSSGEPVYENAQARGDFTQAAEAEALLAELPVSERQIVVLKAVDGLSYKEIGEITGITPEAARKRYTRAIAFLKEKGGF